MSRLIYRKRNSTKSKSASRNSHRSNPYQGAARGTVNLHCPRTALTEQGDETMINRNFRGKGKQTVGLDIADLLIALNRLYADEWLAAYAYNYMAQVVTGRPAAKQLAA